MKKGKTVLFGKNSLIFFDIKETTNCVFNDPKEFNKIIDNNNSVLLGKKKENSPNLKASLIVNKKEYKLKGNSFRRKPKGKDENSNIFDRYGFVSKDKQFKKACYVLFKVTKKKINGNECDQYEKTDFWYLPEDFYLKYKFEPEFKNGKNLEPQPQSQISRTNQRTTNNHFNHVSTPNQFYPNSPNTPIIYPPNPVHSFDQYIKGGNESNYYQSHHNNGQISSGDHVIQNQSQIYQPQSNLPQFWNSTPNHMNSNMQRQFQQQQINREPTQQEIRQIVEKKVLSQCTKFDLYLVCHEFCEIIKEKNKIIEEKNKIIKNLLERLKKLEKEIKQKKKGSDSKKMTPIFELIRTLRDHANDKNQDRHPILINWIYYNDNEEIKFGVQIENIVYEIGKIKELKKDIKNPVDEIDDTKIKELELKKDIKNPVFFLPLFIVFCENKEKKSVIFKEIQTSLISKSPKRKETINDILFDVFDNFELDEKSVIFLRWQFEGIISSFEKRMENSKKDVIEETKKIEKFKERIGSLIGNLEEKDKNEAIIFIRGRMKAIEITKGIDPTQLKKKKKEIVDEKNELNWIIDLDTVISL